MNKVETNIKLSFHEDDYKLIELIPNKNYFYSKKNIEDNKLINDEDNTEFGFSSINLIKEQPIKLFDEKVKYKQVNSILNKISSKSTSNISMGYSTSYNSIKNSKAWGLEYCALLVEYSGRYIKNISLIEVGGDIIIKDDNPKKLLQALIELGNKYNLILIDWNKDLVVDISNKTKAENYLRDELNYSF